MQARPAFVIKAKDFGKSLAFYTEGIGYEVTEQEPATELAVLSGDGMAILLAGPTVTELDPHTAEGYRVLQRGIWRNSEDMDAEREKLNGLGYNEIETSELPWGDREMRVATPEGLTITYQAEPKRTSEEQIALIAAGPDDLKAALDGLSEADYDLTREEGGWSVRQVLHHIVDAEMVMLGELRVGIGVSGVKFAPNWQGNDEMDKGLQYASEPVAPAIALFGASRMVAAQTLNQTPDYAERSVTEVVAGDPSQPGQKRTMQSLVNGMISHAAEHIYEMKEIRKANSK